MIRFHKIVLAVAVAMSVGCGYKDAPGANELDAKTEYSILQGFEYEYRDKDNASVALITEQRVQGSDYDVVGLAKNGVKGYVWFIANANSQPSIKRLPEDGAFVIDEATLAEIDKSVRLSRELRDYFSNAIKNQDPSRRTP